MIRAFLWKERKQHRAFIDATTGLCLLLVFSFSTQALKKDSSLDMIAAGKDGVRAAIIVLALVLAARLIRKEYLEKTQLFLEGLPISRPRMLLVKIGLGFAYLALAIGGYLLSAAIVEMNQPLVTARFLAIVLVRLLGFAVAIYGFACLCNLLGRYRNTIFIAIGTLLLALDSNTDFELSRWGPFVLVDETLTAERSVLPWSALGLSLAIGLGCIAISVLLASVREGSVAGLLGEKMSRKEQIFVVVAFLGGTSALFNATPKKAKAPFALDAGVTTSGGGITVTVADLAGRQQDDAALSRTLHDAFARAALDLAVPELPHVFVAGREDLEPHSVEVDFLPGEEGVLVRGNYVDHDFDRTQLFAVGLHHALVMRSKTRVYVEENHWVLDGFGRFLAAEVDHAVADRVTLRALYAIERGVDPRDFDRWESFSERVGDPLAEAVAASFLRHLASTYGRDEVIALGRALLATDVPRDFRAIFDRRHRTARNLLAKHGDFPALVAEWQRALISVRSQFESGLTAVSTITGAVTVSAAGKNERRVSVALTVEPPPSRVQLYYKRITPKTTALAEAELDRVDRPYRGGGNYDLGQAFERGQMLFVDAAAYAPALGCDVHLGAQRIVVE